MKIKEDFDLKKLEFYGFEWTTGGYLYLIYHHGKYASEHYIYLMVDEDTRIIYLKESLDPTFTRDFLFATEEMFNNDYKLPDVLKELIEAGVVE